MASILNNEKYFLYFKKIGLLYRRPEIRASIEVILSVFSVTVLIFAAIRPTLSNVAALQKKIEDQEIINKKADNKITQLYSAQNQLNTFGNSLQLFDEAIPDNFSYTDSAKRLEYLAKKNNIKIDSLTFSGITLHDGGKVGDWVSKIMKLNTNSTLSNQISFSINGKPQNVLSFLSEIENIDRLVMLNNVSLSKQIGLYQTDDLLKASGQMTFYFYQDIQ
ncbi:MAG TPA: hypothetical protein VLH94_03165 [Spirochaetia bacterium]|nr:hypothetical protein [Spirochaetia bacterium]